jgi:GNAT superfamily N-acetyltransferase
MMIEGAPPGPSDLIRLAELHSVSLTHSPLARLGRPMVGQYYRWAAGSPEEQLLLARDARGVVQGAAVVSRSPDTVLRRFAKTRLARFGAAVLERFAIDHEFRRDALAFAAEALRSQPPLDTAPELLQIFVDAGRRHQSLGRDLVEAIEQQLRRGGATVLWTRTLLEDNDMALAFYRRLGFEAAGETVFCGRTYRLLRRTLLAERP